MLRALPFLLLALVAGCDRSDGDYPRLLPTQQVLAEPVLSENAGPAAVSPDPVRGSVESRAAALRNRAAAIPDPVDDAALAARAADLRRRAEALRRQGETPECPPGTPISDCPKPDS